MRRLSGTIDGIEHVLLEYPDGRVECSGTLRDTLVNTDGTMPTDEALEDACRLLMGDSLVVREM